MTKPNTSFLLRLIFVGALWLAGLLFALYKTGPLFSSEKIVSIIMMFLFTAGFAVVLWHIGKKLSPNHKFPVWFHIAVLIPAVVVMGMNFMKEPTALRLVATICLIAALVGLIHEGYIKEKMNKKNDAPPTS